MVDFSKALRDARALQQRIDALVAGTGSLRDLEQHLTLCALWKQKILAVDLPSAIDEILSNYSDLPAFFAGPQVSEEDQRCAIVWAIREIELAKKHGVEILPFGHPKYPAELRSIPDPPAYLYVKGDLAPHLGRCAVVGTREPTVFGATVTKRVVAALCERNVSIVSGMAIGVDTVAHETALAAKGHTIAVLPNALDESPYPPVNADLARRILASGGALVSEMPFGEQLNKAAFVQRNRIQSGMSRAVFVSQTDVRGGTMHTVRHAVMQDRPVFVPYPTGEHANADTSQGILALADVPACKLHKVIDATGEYREALDSVDVPVATAIRSKEDYPKLFAVLR